MMPIFDFKKKFNEKKPLSLLTCYDSTFASLLNRTQLDGVLIGDSYAQVMAGHPSTVFGDINHLIYHTQCVSRVLDSSKLVVADIPFLRSSRSLDSLLEDADQLMKAGAHAIKIEGDDCAHIETLVKSGVPVMGHLGLLPQSVMISGKYEVQGRSEAAQNRLVESAKKLESQGVFALVLECIPTELARSITDSLHIPTIGIGAGPHTSGQILVLQDMLGLSPHKYKFVRKYLSGSDLIINAVEKFTQDVSSQSFPNPETEAYS